MIKITHFGVHMEGTNPHLTMQQPKWSLPSSLIYTTNLPTYGWLKPRPTFWVYITHLVSWFQQVCQILS